MDGFAAAAGKSNGDEICYDFMCLVIGCSWCVECVWAASDRPYF